MKVERLTRVNELLRREIAQALFRLIHEEGFDLSAVTVTHVFTSANLRHARVLVSIRDHQGERNAMLSRLNHHRKEIQRTIGRNVTLKFTPQLAFELDTSLETGDRVLRLLDQLDDPATAPPREPTAADDFSK